MTICDMFFHNRELCVLAAVHSKYTIHTINFFFFFYQKWSYTPDLFLKTEYNMNYWTWGCAQ